MVSYTKSSEECAKRGKFHHPDDNFRIFNTRIVFLAPITKISFQKLFFLIFFQNEYKILGGGHH